MGVVDDFAAQVGWALSKANVIVEGTSDVRFFQHASALHEEKFGIPLIDGDFQVCAAGRGDDGGVEGVNRMLVTASQLAATDRLPNGRQRYRFLGLLDNDPAGRRGIDGLVRFTSRLREFRDVFLLYPEMPICDTQGMTFVQDRMREFQKSFGDDYRFEIEDLMSPGILGRFEQLSPGAIIKKVPFGSRFHYHFKRSGKPHFQQFVFREASPEDYAGFFAVVKALRSYLDLEHSRISSNA